MATSSQINTGHGNTEKGDHQKALQKQDRVGFDPNGTKVNGASTSEYTKSKDPWGRNRNHRRNFGKENLVERETRSKKINIVHMKKGPEVASSLPDAGGRGEARRLIGKNPKFPRGKRDVERD